MAHLCYYYYYCTTTTKFKLNIWNLWSKCLMWLWGQAYDNKFIIRYLSICDTGYVMYIDANQNTGLSEATLEHSFDKQAALGCQIRYWFTTDYVLDWYCALITSNIFLEFLTCLYFELWLLMYFSFWYHIYKNASSPLPSSPTLKVTLVRPSTETTLLEFSKGNTNGWQNASAFIGNQPGGYKVRTSSFILLGCRQRFRDVRRILYIMK